MRLSRPERPLSLSPIWLSVGFAVLASAFLIVKAHDFVKPYARAYHMAKSIDADIVLVDTRGGVFIQDIVRVEDGDFSEAMKRLHTSRRSEEHTSELQSLMRISYAVFCLKKKKTQKKRDAQ